MSMFVTKARAYQSGASNGVQHRNFERAVMIAKPV
jgi:hypothetical protein